MSNFQGLVGGLWSNVSQSLVSSAINAVTTSANRALDPFTVQEITGTNVNDVSEYPVFKRTGSLLFHGPIPSGRFRIRSAAFQLIIHAPNSRRMFSMLKTDSQKEAEDTFVLYKESFPLLVECDPSICEAQKLDQMAKKLRENPGWTAPHLAAAFGLVGCLKHERLVASLNDQEEVMLRTPLLVAIDQGNAPSVLTLLDIGVDVTIKDIKNNTVFHVAATQNPVLLQVLITKLPLVHHDLLNHLNTEGFTPLHAACNNNNYEFVKALLNAGANPTVCSVTSGHPIHCAIKAQSIACVQELVAKNPELLQSKDLQDGASPLHWAMGPETLLPLLDLGCDPNAVDPEGLTPLHHAVRRGCLTSTLQLLCHGAYPDMKGGEEENAPLHIAAKLCSRLLIEALIVFGADINIVNKHGDSARHLVCTSTRSDSDLLLFTLSAAGAGRCSATKQARCVDGCKYSGSFEGNPPPNFKSNGTVNLMEQTLSAFASQKFATESQAMETQNATGSPRTANATDNTEGDYNCGGRLLCLDGGGIRGIVLAQILFVIEQELQMPVIDLFDWVAGTSTGGILALSLACKKSPLETQRIYMRLKDKVFVGERPYSANVMQEFLQKEFGHDTTMGSIHKPKVMIMTAMVDRRPVDLHIFRNYKSPHALIDSEPYIHEYSTQYVWEAAKVTGAAPSYFRLDNDRFIDGGLISNNPTLDALTELHQYQAVMKSLGYFRSSQKLPTTVVSIGTGIPPKTDSNASLLDITWPSGIFDAITKVPRLASLVNLLIDQATQSEGQVVERSRAWCSAIGVPFFRFSPQMSDHIDLDEKCNEKLIHLLWETRCYMMANKQVIQDMKRILMEQAT